MELKEGYYIRTKQGEIHKIKSINDKYIEYENGFGVPYDLKDYYIVKFSPNIIDLIEVGDYVNGSLVDQIDNYSNGYICVNVDRNSEMGFREISFKNEDIKSIVTKEMFESISYKVGD